VWNRLVAYVVDLVIMGTIGIVLRAIFLAHQTGFAGLYALSLSALVVHAVYLIALWPTGQTVGMRVTGLTVLRAQDGGRLTLAQATLRFIPFGLALVTLFLGLFIWLAMFITVATDSRGQGLQDRLAGSVVVRRAG